MKDNQVDSSFSSNSKEISVIACHAVVPLFRDPNTRTERVDEMLYGMGAAQLGNPMEGWAHIRTRYGYEGFVQTCDLRSSDTCVPDWESTASDRVFYPFADVMSEPASESTVLHTLPRGSAVARIGPEEERWVQVRMVDGLKGWMCARLLQQNSDIPDPGSDAWGERVAQTALSYLGTQYRWGGKSPLGIDCSGLSSMAWALNGVSLPRDADQQQDVLQSLPREQARAGDLLFSPGHVMIALDTERYVHATGREGFVLINSFNPKDPAYRSDLDVTCTCAGR